MADFNPLVRPKIADSILDVIGFTPIVRLGKVGQEAGVVANILLKLESMEPCCSIQDRIAKGMVLAAEERGDIVPGETILVEPSSGNTGIGLAMVAAARGYKLIVVMPASVSIERRVMIKALGAKVVLTPGDKDMKYVIDKADEIIATQVNGKGFMLQQFDNDDNAGTHRKTTGPEIWDQTDGKVDILVSGIGTGGTATGIMQYLLPRNNNVKLFAVEPAESQVLSGGKSGQHNIQGLGVGFIPRNCDTSFIDTIVRIKTKTAITTARNLATMEGIFVGISSGAAVAAAIQIGCLPENAEKNIVVIVPSFGERYLSSELFADLHLEAVNQEVEPLRW